MIIFFFKVFSVIYFLQCQVKGTTVRLKISSSLKLDTLIYKQDILCT